MKKYILLISTIVLLVLGGAFCLSHSSDKQSPHVVKVDTEYVKIHDTVKIYAKAKVKVESVFVVDSSKIANIKDTSELKLTFNKVFPKLDTDSTKTDVAYSQVKKTLITNDRYLEDSSLLDLTTKQLSVCTTGVTNIKNKADSTIDSAKKMVRLSYDSGYSSGNTNNKKNLLIGGLVITLVSLLLGHFI